MCWSDHLSSGTTCTPTTTIRRECSSARTRAGLPTSSPNCEACSPTPTVSSGQTLWPFTHWLSGPGATWMGNVTSVSVWFYNIGSVLRKHSTMKSLLVVKVSFCWTFLIVTFLTKCVNLPKMYWTQLGVEKLAVFLVDNRQNFCIHTKTFNTIYPKIH